MTKYNMSKIMSTAWNLFKKGVASFAECLHRSWEMAKAAPVNAETIQTAKENAGVQEETRTWYGWKELGFEVAHGSKALFQAVIKTPAKGEGKTFKMSFFGFSQVVPAGTQEAA